MSLKLEIDKNKLPTTRRRQTAQPHDVFITAFGFGEVLPQKSYVTNSGRQVGKFVG